MNTIRVDTGSQSLLWGVGLFETMLVTGGRIILEREHFDRMVASASELRFPLPSSNAWTSATRSALRDVGSHRECALRCSYLDIDSRSPDSPGWRMIASAFDIPPITMSRRRRGRVILLPPEIRRSTPKHKSSSHLASVIGLRLAGDAGADEGLFTSARGGILEGTSTNVFAIDKDTLLTPPVRAGILPGVIRRWVIENASRADLRVRTRVLRSKDLLRGSFLTSSLTCLSDIRNVDGVACRDAGERFRELARLFTREHLECGG